MSPVVFHSVHVASLVLRPVDVLREHLKRPPWERGPVRPVPLVVMGRVTVGGIDPLPAGTRDPIRNLSGDSVYRDLALPAGTYRVTIDPAATGALDYYASPGAADRDVVWDPQPAVPHTVGGRPHPSHLHIVHLAPRSTYPYEAEATLIRGTLRWYDGTALEGAVLDLGAAVVNPVPVDDRGEFALLLTGAFAGGTVTITLNLAAVDPLSRPDGTAYLNLWPATWAVPWRRGRTSSARQASLLGYVLDQDDRPLPGATVTLAGRPGSVTTNPSGRWSYFFPPTTPDGTVNIEIDHPSHPTRMLPNTPFRSEAAVRVPTVRLP